MLPQKLQHLFEQDFYHAFGFAATKIVDRTKIRTAHPAKPHKMDILTQGLGYFTTRVDLTL